MSEQAVHDETKIVLGIRKVLELADKLMAMQDFDLICKSAVEFARRDLGVERCGLFLWDGQSEMAQGTYGTNINGETTDEHTVFSNAKAEFYQKREEGEARWIYKEDSTHGTMTDDGYKRVGEGWRVGTPLQTSGEVIGAFFNDTAITHAPFDESLQEVVACYCSILATILLRKRNEIAKNESDSRYRLLFQNNPQLMYVYDLDTLKIIDVNNAAIDVYGYSRQEFLNLTLEDLAPHRSKEELRDQIERLKKNGRLFTNLEHVRKDGSRNHVQLNAHVVEYDGKRVGISQVVDVTEYKRALQNIDRLAAFVKFNPNPVLEINGEGKVVFANPASKHLCESTGVDRVELLLPMETADAVNHCLEKGEPKLRIETKFSDRTFSWSFFPVPDKNVVHCYGGEITEKIRLEEQFRHAQKMESVGRLAGGVAHDFNNILTAILGYSNLMKMRTDLKPDVIAEVDQITLAAQRAANLTKQLLAFSRKQYVTLKDTDLNHSVRNMEKMLHTLLGEDVKLETRLDEKIPPVLADANMMDQVILNLAVNARDAMPEGGTLAIFTGEVQVSAQRAKNVPDATPGKFVRLSVSDTGIGMDDAVKAKIFEPFFTTKGQGKGTGLGLSTVYGIVRQHQGWIEVKSHVGEGTTFEVYLPCSQKETKETSSGLPAELVNISKKATVFIVEDEDAVRTIARTILERQGCKVLEAPNAVKALQIWEDIEKEVDVLLTDMVMPENMSGRELATRLIERKPNLKIIFSSGYTQENLATDSETFPDSMFLAKPYSSNDLVKAVQSRLSLLKSH